MQTPCATIRLFDWTVGLCVVLAANSLAAGELWPLLLPEQTTVQVRDPSELPSYPIASTPRPPTVSDPQFDIPPRYFSLDEAIATGLANSEVVRVLSGVTAASSGRTVYDLAITNTQIDQQQALFDPTATVNNTWSRADPPGATLVSPTQSIFTGTRTDNHNLNFDLSKRASTGGVVNFGVTADASQRTGVFPLNPQNRSSLDLSFTQPLLQGGGIAVNRAPIVLARIDTERSFFQYKNSVQQHVQGIIAAYWSLVFARTDLWAREQQVEQAEFANERTERRLAIGDANSGETAQTRVALENFRAALLGAQANVLQREAALRNILGFPPFDPNRVVPVTPPNSEPLDLDWRGIVELAERQRPDIIELKLILEADEQALLQASNQVNPRVDAVALYRWNGLEGTMPSGLDLRSRPGQFTDWNLAINFSVPLSLRRERAALRQRELIIARDRANLEQGVHQMVHLLALSLRSLDQFYQQYLRFQAVRAAARINLERQMRAYDEGIIQFVTVLQAIVDWGNSVSAEAQSLTQYNTELSNMELATGTILEAHGVAFYEERFGSIGPLGRFAHDRCYPSSSHPTPSVDVYPEGDQPSEEWFDLQDPLENRGSAPSAPSPAPMPAPTPGVPYSLEREESAALLRRLPNTFPATSEVVRAVSHHGD